MQSLSVIIIARNESYAIKKCLASLASMSLEDSEVICVDSNSTDDTLEVMKSYINKFLNYRIIECTGRMNAARARNVGLACVSKNTILFVDGDVELNPDFIILALAKMADGKASAITGTLDEIVYSNDYNNILRPRYSRIYYKNESQISNCGGIFMVERKLLYKVGLWNEKMDCNEDVDYTLRISRYSRFIGLPIIMGTHHTLSYKERALVFFRRKYPMYFGMVLRENLDRPLVVFSLLANNRGYLAGFTFYLILSIGVLINSFYSVEYIYFLNIALLLLIADLLLGIIKKKNVVNHFIIHYLNILMIIMGLFYDRNELYSSEDESILLYPTIKFYAGASLEQQVKVIKHPQDKAKRLYEVE